MSAIGSYASATPVTARDGNLAVAKSKTIARISAPRIRNSSQSQPIAADSYVPTILSNSELGTCSSNGRSSEFLKSNDILLIRELQADVTNRVLNKKKHHHENQLLPGVKGATSNGSSSTSTGSSSAASAGK